MEVESSWESSKTSSEAKRRTGELIPSAVSREIFTGLQEKKR
jgi:hypothetical protein